MTRQKMTPEQFWGRVDRSGGPNSCWPIRPPHQRGYGKVVIWGVSGAHRVAWVMTNGPIPAGLQIRHSCDNPPCCNPAHLQMGTLQENEADKRARGRTWLQGRSGEANHQARLSSSTVAEIRRLYAAGGISHAKLALQFGIHKRYVWTIIHNLKRKAG
jgi:DNA-binding CsgD family transcriptional regulator